jgi:hypothetical protein
LRPGFARTFNEKIAVWLVSSTQALEATAAKSFASLACGSIHVGTKDATGFPGNRRPAMPYLRLYSRDLPITGKRIIAEKLIDITVRTFHLRAKERNQVTIQFVTLPRKHEVRDFAETDFVLEVIGHNLTQSTKEAFSEEASAMLVDWTPVTPMTHLARLMHMAARTRKKIAFQFNELSPAVSEPFVESPEHSTA